MIFNEKFKKINPTTFLSDYLTACGIKSQEEFLEPSGINLEAPTGYYNIEKGYQVLKKYVGKDFCVLVD